MPRYKPRRLGERLFRLLSTPEMARYAALPGPAPVAILGNIADFLDGKPLWAVAAEHARRHDRPTVVWLLNKPVVVVADVRSIEAVLRDRSGSFEKARPFATLLPAGPERADSPVLQKTGWKLWRARHPLAQTWAAGWRDAQLGAMRRVIEERVDRWVTSSSGWLDIEPQLRRLAFDAFAVAAVGQPLDDSLWRHFTAVAGALDVRGTRPLAPLSRFSPLFSRHRAAWYRSFERDIQRVRSADASARDDRCDLVTTMLQHGVTGDERKLAQVLSSLFLHGVMPSADALLSCLSLLADHPEAQERLDAAVRGLSAGGEYCAEDLARTPYIAAVVRESMRLSPPVPLFWRRVSREGPARLGEAEIPAGTTLWVVNANAHRDPRYYEQPAHFMPERWLDGGAERNPLGSGQYCPFGAGPRMCIGADFAIAFLQVALTAIVSRASVEFKNPAAYRQTRLSGSNPQVVEARFRPAQKNGPTFEPVSLRTPEETRLPASIERPPLASGLPWMGAIAGYLRRPLDFFTDEVARIGPVFRMRILGEDMVVMAAGTGAPLVAADRASCPFTRQGMFRAFATETEVDMFGVDGAEHQRLRKMVRLGYSRHVVAQFVPDMVETTRGALRSYRPGEDVAFLGLSEEIALRCIMTCLTPVDLSGVLDAVQRLGDDVMYVTTGLRPDAIFKLPDYVKARTRVQQAVDEAIARHAAGEFANRDRMRMIDALLTTRDNDGQPLGARGIRGSAIYALCGTHVYLGRLLAFLVYEITRNHELLRHVQREVDAAFASGPLSADVFRRMRHMRGAYIETLRMYPLVSGLLFRAARDFEVNGYRVDEGQNVLVTSIPDHYDPVIHANPFNFDASRGANRRQAQKVGSFSPFGLRPRVCAAAGLVEIVVLTAAATILHTMRLQLTRPTYRPRLALQPLLCPADGLPLVIQHLRTDIDRIIDPSALAIDVDDDPLLVEHSNSLANFEVEAINVEVGTDIVREGEPPDWFYVIVHGTADVYQRQPDGADERVASLTQGQIFGELGLLMGLPRNATVRAREGMGLLRLDRDTFLTLVAESDLLGQELGRLLQRRFMRKAIAEALPRLSGQLALSALEGVSLRHYAPGDVIIKQGDPADHFYILAAGEAEVIAEDGHGGGHLLVTLEKGAAFGEIGILTRRPRTATVRVSSKGPAVVMQFNRDRFEAVVAESPDATQDLALIIQRRILRHLETLEHGAPSES